MSRRPWNHPDHAPYDEAVEVRVYGGKRFRAQLKRDASMTEDEKPCDQWQAEDGEKHPRDWCGGACWESNSEGLASDPVVGWRRIEE
ncbi:hypothetical protein FHR22_002585 [Sphingopyxis panaciterrae]|uniref:hypothetical protein n=1 Tax=Sphingopyxis panaciterrae TaxID=363841 RepID=UPI001422FE10|nr:hypothetical protein [Sphingopyxis panaciterrae]NIJ37882.1 hypothetical protein [Sphingopyxis panaciterrae]